MAVSPDHVPSTPDCSIEGKKPTIAPISAQYLLKKGQSPKCCVLCGSEPTKIATYSVQGATIIERYCDPCVEKQFSRSDTSNGY